jgi:crotonobetainyl-CoA:carnitine CoA-transferase CaiB-like acyl-CoA transferase
MQALGGSLVIDLTRYLPGAFASRELLRLGARVVRIEQPGGDPMRATAPEWHDDLNAGKESVVCDLPADAPFAQALLARADVVLESFRPGEQRAGHDLNYVGWAGVLHSTAPALPPVQAADLAAGALGAVTEVLAALLARERTGEGARIVVSMTHGAHRLVSRSPVLTQGYACYSVYETKDGRMLTVAALEPKFFARLCELLGCSELARLQYDDEQAPLRDELGRVFATRALADWLDRFEGEDVCVGPVATLAEASRDFGEPMGVAPVLGEHTEHWRRELAA